MPAQQLAQINLGASGQFANLNLITFPGVIAALITIVFIIAAIIFFFMLVAGGIRYISSGGDKAQTESARSQITAAIIGLVIVFATYAIINLLNTFFGIDIYQLNIPTASQP
jgi:hypothetical protein